MIRGRMIRTFLAALLVLTQSAGGSFAAQMAEQGAPCVLHVALLSSAGHAPEHHGHGHADGENHEHGSADGEDHTAPHFSAACCIACAAAVPASDVPLQAPAWLRSPAIPVTQGLEPGELPGTDPPPRVLL